MERRVGSIVLAALLGWAPRAFGFGPDPTTAAARFRFVVLGDTHVTTEDLAVSRARLRSAVDEINGFASEIAFVLVTGDLGQSGLAANLATELGAARAELDRLTVPYHVAIGNHDVTAAGDDSAYRSLFGAASYRFVHDGMHFVALRTVQTQASAAISLAALDSLSANLAAIAPGAPLVVFAHHPLGPLTPLGVTNSNEFYSRVDFHNLAGVFSGHWHGVFEEARNGAWYCTSGSIAVHRSNHDDTTTRGYRLVTVTPAYALASKFYELGSPPDFLPAPPVLVRSGNRYVMPGRTLSLQIEAADADGDAVTYAAANLPAGAAFDAGTRRFTWTPTGAQVGFHPGIDLTASDPSGTDTMSLGVRVLPSACVYEDFAAAQAAWQTWGGTWGVTAEALAQTNSSSGSYYDTVAGVFSDVHFEADLRHDGGDGYAGLTFRFQDPNNNYYLWNDGARIQVRRRVNGSAIEIGRPVAVGPIAGWHHVRVETIGSSIKVYWDGEAAIDLVDATFATGRIGFVCSRAAATFDNLVVVGCPTLPNRAPVLAPVGARSVIAGTPVVIDVAATDPDGASTVAATNLPPGSTFDPALGRFTWTPGVAAAGVWPDVTFSAHDGELQDAERVRFTVFDATDACLVEDFASVGSGSTWTPTSGTWSVSAGTYSGTSAGTATSRSSMSAVENFVLQARARVAGTGWGGIVFRSVDATHYDYLAISSASDLVELRKMNGATSTKLAGGAEVDGDAGEWHLYRVECAGPRLRVFVDDVLVYDYTDTGAGTGGRVYVAGTAGAYVQNASVWLDDLVLASCANQVTDAGTAAPPAATLDLSVFPNPFNPSTTIRLTLGQPGRAHATLYDVAGRRVRMLTDADFAAGTHVLRWDGTDGEGRSMASGVYYLNVQTAGAARMERLVLVR